MDRSTQQKISKETQALNDTMDQLDLIDIYMAFHQNPMNFTFILKAHGTFSRKDHILGHKSSLGKFLKIKINSSIFSDHKALRLDVNYRKKKNKKQKKTTIKNTNIQRLNNTLPNNQEIMEQKPKYASDQIRSDQSLSRVRLFVTP